jgi:hypothetical protein
MQFAHKSKPLPVVALRGCGTASGGVERRRKKRMSRFAHNMAALSEKPKWHMVFNLDKKVRRKWPIEEATDVFKKFGTYLQKRYPHSWFLWIMEYTEKAGPHFHMLGRFNGKASNKAVFGKWRELTGSTWEKAATKRDFHPAHVGYLAKPGKATGTRHLIRHLGSKSFWGIINRKNMPLHVRQTYTLTSDQFLIFRNKLKKLLVKHNGAQSSVDRPDKSCSGLRFCTHEMIQTALAAALKPQRT